MLRINKLNFPPTLDNAVYTLQIDRTADDEARKNNIQIGVPIEVHSIIEAWKIYKPVCHLWAAVRFFAHMEKTVFIRDPENLDVLLSAADHFYKSAVRLVDEKGNQIIRNDELKDIHKKIMDPLPSIEESLFDNIFSWTGFGDPWLMKVMSSKEGQQKADNSRDKYSFKGNQINVSGEVQGDVFIGHKKQTFPPDQKGSAKEGEPQSSDVKQHEDDLLKEKEESNAKDQNKNIFRRNEDIWEIVFNGEKAELPLKEKRAKVEGLGLYYIQYLIGRYMQEREGDIPSDNTISALELEDLIRTEMGYGPDEDDNQLNGYKSYQLQEHGVEARRTRDNDAARKRVNATITHGINRIAAELPDLAKHLHKSIEIKTHYCQYFPPNKITWIYY